MRCRCLGFIVPLVLGILVAPLAAEAQPAGKVARIGYLALGTVEVQESRVAAFRQGLRELGYVEGENIIIEQRYAAGRLERLPELAAELVRLKVDVLVTSGGAQAAQQASSTIPIVMISHPDPVGEGLVASLAHPGGNLTGLADAHGDLGPKRLDLLKQAVSSVSRVAVLFSPAFPISGPQWQSLQAAAPHLGLTLLPWEAGGGEGIEHAFATISKDRPDALLVIGDQTLLPHTKQIAELAVQHRLPAISTIRTWAEAGILLAYGANFDDLYRHAADYVDKILKGAKPTDLPVEQPTKFELVINLKTAKALGLTLPQSILIRADEVLE